MAIEIGQDCGHKRHTEVVTGTWDCLSARDQDYVVLWLSQEEWPRLRRIAVTYVTGPTLPAMLFCCIYVVVYSDSGTHVTAQHLHAAPQSRCVLTM